MSLGSWAPVCRVAPVWRLSLVHDASIMDLTCVSRIHDVDEVSPFIWLWPGKAQYRVSVVAKGTRNVEKGVLRVRLTGCEDYALVPTVQALS